MLAIPAGLAGRHQRALKNKRKLASLLRDCYHQLLPLFKPEAPIMSNSCFVSVTER
jgi:hypothetical protein